MGRPRVTSARRCNSMSCKGDVSEAAHFKKCQDARLSGHRQLLRPVPALNLRAAADRCTVRNKARHELDDSYLSWLYSLDDLRQFLRDRVDEEFMRHRHRDAERTVVQNVILGPRSLTRG